MRPWRDWRTVETEHFAVHYPAEYREWSLALASRLESVRAGVQQVVGFAPRGRVHIVIDDPANDANGLAFTTLDEPTIVLYPTPPSPREVIGNFRVWNELVATHEFAHIAHLTRPTRNRLQNLLWSLSPIPLGPIATRSPRWVHEGYATYVEGRVTGSGRPNHAWRAAILRQFAIEGRLPTYGQVNGGGAWRAGDFAYLAGSAYFEWLARRQGDSSLTALWRRLTARTDRSFDEAFAGVYGGSPGELYARFTAELTADAIALERAMTLSGVTDGELVQRLVRSTGDPAISPDGRFVALTVRRTDRPSQLVVWKTTPEPDTLAAGRRAQQLARDPEDVPDRAFYPPPKHVVAKLDADDGSPFESPRWYPDNKHLLVTRSVPRADGSLRPDLYVWSAEDGTLQRLTHGAALRDADISGDARWAAAVRCAHGWCDLVRVDLRTGAVRVIRAGSVERNYYRPRVSKLTGEIVVGEQLGDRWRIARVSPESGALVYADPDDGATRYDATFAPDGRTIIATSERSGIANLERLSASGGDPITLTSVTGAAIASDVAPDGGIWFLGLRAAGYDLRRLEPDSAGGAARGTLPRVSFLDSLSPITPPRTRAPFDSAARPAARALPAERSYGTGPSRFRYFPLAASGFGGTSLQLALERSDPIGRVGIQLVGSAGAGALPAGGVLSVVSRRFENALTLTGWASHEAPSRVYAPAHREALDLARSGGALRLDRVRTGDAGERWLSLAAVLEQQRPSGFEASTRAAGIVSLVQQARQRDDDTRYVEQISLLGESGRTGDGSYLRERVSLLFGTATGSRALATVRLAYGSVGGGGTSRESFAIGGFASPLVDPLLDGRRVDAPAYPVGSAGGSTFVSYHVMLPLDPLQLFYQGVSPDLLQHTLRSFGAELRQHIAAVPALGTPSFTLLAGLARASDAPVAREWRSYLQVTLRP